MNPRQIVNGIYLPAWDTHFGKHLRSGEEFEGKGTYQFGKIKDALDLCPRRNMAIDIGAHVGLWSRVLAAHFRRVLAFEPMPEFADCFDLNLAGQSNVLLHRVALGERAGTARIAVVTSGVATAHIAEEGIEVDVRRLDQFGAITADFIKIDVEGFDVPIIRGAEMIIRRDKPVIVVEQKGRSTQYGNGVNEATEILTSWGMKVAWERGDVCLVWE